MPIDKSATPSRREAARAAFRFILLLGLLDAFGPPGIDMYLPAVPHQAGAASALLEMLQFAHNAS